MFLGHHVHYSHTLPVILENISESIQGVGLKKAKTN
jgi:hypothetical protein